MRRTVFILIPSAAIVIVLFMAIFSPETFQLYFDSEIIVYSPYIFYMLTFLLGIWFNHSRFSFASFLLAGVYLLLSTLLEHPAQLERAICLGTIAVPVTFAVIHFLPERGVVSSHGVFILFLTFAEICLIFALPGIENLWSTYPFLAILIRFDMPVLGLAPAAGTVSLAIAVILIEAIHRRESSLHWVLSVLALLAFFIGLTFPVQKTVITQFAVLSSFTTLSALILAFGVLSYSWDTTFLDELTEIPGRRSLEHQLLRLRGLYSIAMLDIDHFKRINDTYGHDTGDQVLRFVAARLQSIPFGRVYRYGGEEFTVLSQGIAEDSIVKLLDELRESLEAMTFVVRDSERRSRHDKARSGKERPKARERITISIGIAQRKAQDETPDEVLIRADKALYHAKNRGRNRVETG